MLKNTPFLRWWLSFILILLGTGTAGYLGLFGQVNEADTTKISFLIYGLFAIYTVLTGINTKKACKEGEKSPMNQNLNMPNLLIMTSSIPK